MVADIVKPVLFTNWTSEDFTYSFDGAPWHFKAGSSIYLEEPKAEHFAKHLVDRELHKKGLQVNFQGRTEMVQRCFGHVAEEKLVGPEIETQLMNLNNPLPVAESKAEPQEEEFPDLKPVEIAAESDRFCNFCTSKGGRHLKVCTKT